MVKIGNLRFNTQGIALISSGDRVRGFGTKNFIREVADEVGGVLPDRPYRLPDSLADELVKDYDALD